MQKRGSTVFSALAALALVPACSNATTFSSFLPVDAISGITVSNIGLAYTVSLNSAPSFTLGSTTYDISDVFGFYALSELSDFVPIYALSPVDPAGPIGPFNDDSSNSGPGGVQGWKSNPNKGLKPNDSVVFTFDNLDTAHFTQVGFHVRLANQTSGEQTNFPGTTGNTGNIKLVPEPTSIAALALGLGSVLARRVRRKA